MTRQPRHKTARASAGRPTPKCSCASRAARAGIGGIAPIEWFSDMISHCLDYAEAAKAAGRPIVGIMCEYTPRELIMAAGAVPVCLCGGDVDTIHSAERHLPINLCPLIKSTYGYLVERSNPFLEMAALLVAETTCDGKKKMYELMARSRPMHLLELPHKEDSRAALAHWTGEMKRLKKELETRFRVTIADAKLRRAIKAMNYERALKRRLADLMRSDDPVLSGRQLIKFKSSISCIDADLRMYERALAEFASAPPRPDLARRVRVLMTGVPIVHGAEKVLDIVEKSGGLVVAMENCTGLKPILDDVDEKAPDPLAALAKKYFALPCSVRTPNAARLESLRKIAARYRPQCVIELVWQACLTYDVEAYHVRRFVEDELRLPYLKVETDYSPSDSARIAVRVEALYETVRGAASINRSC